MRLIRNLFVLSYLCVMLIFGTAFFSPVLAHGIQETVERTVDKYLVQINFDALEAQFGDPVPISFRLSDTP